RRDGTVWTADKDGIIAALLAAEITARAQRDPGEIYRDLTGALGDPLYERIDTPATPEQKAILAKLRREDVVLTDLAGEPIQTILTAAPGNGQSIGGVKVISEGGWFAARPSGTEDVYKLYAESYHGAEHLRRIEDEARAVINRVCAEAPH